MTYTWDNARGLLGIALTIAVAWVVSEHRRRFPLVLIVGALAVQVAYRSGGGARTPAAPRS